MLATPTLIETWCYEWILLEPLTNFVKLESGKNKLSSHVLHILVPTRVADAWMIASFPGPARLSLAVILYCKRWTCRGWKWGHTNDTSPKHTPLVASFPGLHHHIQFSILQYAKTEGRRPGRFHHMWHNNRLTQKGQCLMKNLKTLLVISCPSTLRLA